MRALLLLFLSICAGAQSFDVASVRAHPPEDDRFGVKMPSAGQFYATGVTAKQLLMLGFDMQETQIAGGPEWLDSAKWDVEAKSESTQHSVEETRRMLQALLQERFALRSRRETQQRAGYVLSIAKGGAKFKAATEGSTSIRVAVNSIQLERGSIRQLTQALSAALERPVVDSTGLSGTYDLAVQWDDAPRGQSVPGRDYGSIFTALQEQLGLRLDPQQIAVDVVVIERMDRPSQN
jgi:uncharacterized protein (TIGR03435 family)